MNNLLTLLIFIASSFCNRQIEGKTIGPGGAQASSKSLKNIMVVPYATFCKMALEKNVNAIRKLGNVVQKVDIRFINNNDNQPL